MIPCVLMLIINVGRVVLKAYHKKKPVFWITALLILVYIIMSNYVLLKICDTINAMCAAKELHMIDAPMNQFENDPPLRLQNLLSVKSLGEEVKKEEEEESKSKVGD